MHSRVEAIIFDLYGTLVRVTEPAIARRLPRLLDAGVRPWMDLVRGRLLTSSFADRREFVRFICGEFGAEPGSEIEATCLTLVERELASVELVPGVHSLLAFLKRRGYALGLLSNLTSVHKEPVERLGLLDHFKAVSFSCDTGIAKPDPRAYLGLCDRLGVDRDAVLVVGDSLSNDVEMPRSLGLEALHVAPKGLRSGIAEVTDLGWMLIDDRGHPKRLVGNGSAVTFGENRLSLGPLHPVADEEQGRYNLVARTEARQVDGAGPPVEVFCKRFLFPEAAYVEEFAHKLLRRLGMPACQALVTDGPEPCLLLTKAPGVKLQGDADPPLAFEIGRHCAIGYIFANADLRPRNAFAARESGRAIVTMIDLEHWFFNLALRLDGLQDPFRPETFDRLPADELHQRLQKQVLTERTTRRAMRSFLELDNEGSDVGRAFKTGWVTAYEQVTAQGVELCQWIDQRVHTEPFLIIGTQAYRRAMARVDVDDIHRRMKESPEALFPRLAALKAQA